MARALDSTTSSTLARALGMILNPSAEWQKVAAEETPSAEIFRRYVLPLALIGPVCGTIGNQVFGYGAMGVAYHPSLISAIIGGAVAFVLGLVGFLLLTIIANLLSPKFGGTLNTNKSYALVAYGATPVWLVGVFQLVPMLGIFGLLSFYSIYLTYLGAAPVLGVPREKSGSFTLVYVLCAIVMNIVVAMLSASNMALLGGMGLLG